MDWLIGALVAIDVLVVAYAIWSHIAADDARDRGGPRDRGT